eukprot:4086902-Alexandrium_andersonii.AAC.1
MKLKPRVVRMFMLGSSSSSKPIDWNPMVAKLRVTALRPAKVSSESMSTVRSYWGSFSIAATKLTGGGGSIESIARRKLM